MTLPEIRAAMLVYRNEGRMFSPAEWAGMVEALLPDAERYAWLRQQSCEAQSGEAESCYLMLEPDSLDFLIDDAIDQARKP